MKGSIHDRLDYCGSCDGVMGLGSTRKCYGCAEKNSGAIKSLQEDNSRLLVEAAEMRKAKSDIEANAVEEFRKELERFTGKGGMMSITLDAFIIDYIKKLRVKP